MNDLVFVLYNLKLKRRQAKRASKSVIQEPITLDDMPSDDEWITEVEEPILPTGNTWLNNFDRAARRLAREATQAGEGGEDPDDEFDDETYENVEIQMLSDDDNELNGTFVGSNDGIDDESGDVQIGTTTTGTDEDVNDVSFGFDD